MSLSTSESSQQRILTSFSISGGILVIVGFFLPWYAVATSNGLAVEHYSTVSGWDQLYIHLTGTPLISDQAKGIPVFGYALIQAFPLWLAIVAIVVGIVALRTKVTPFLIGLSATAGVFGALGLPQNSMVVSYAINQTAALPGYPGTAGIGIVLLTLGFFGIIVGSIASFKGTVQSSS
jgi:hypothetical protein